MEKERGEKVDPVKTGLRLRLRREAKGWEVKREGGMRVRPYARVKREGKRKIELPTGSFVMARE